MNIISRQTPSPIKNGMATAYPNGVRIVDSMKIIGVTTQIIHFSMPPLFISRIAVPVIATAGPNARANGLISISRIIRKHDRIRIR